MLEGADARERWNICWGSKFRQSHKPQLSRNTGWRSDVVAVSAKEERQEDGRDRKIAETGRWQREAVVDSTVRL